METINEGLKNIELLKGCRHYIFKNVHNMSKESLLKVPHSFKNNILWNIGHIIASQQILNYTLSGVTPRVDDQFLSYFRKGSSPEKWSPDNYQPDIDQILHLLQETPVMLEEDYNNNLFTNFKPYTTTAGSKLNDILDSMTYNQYHEGIHTGWILALKKLVE